MFSRRGPSGCRRQLSRPLPVEGREGWGTQLLSKTNKQKKPYSNKTLQQQKPAWVEGVGVGRKGLQACAEALLFCCAPRVFWAQLFWILPSWRTRPLALHEAPVWALEVGSWGMTCNFSLHTLLFFLDKTLLRFLKTVPHLECREMQQENLQNKCLLSG